MVEATHKNWPPRNFCHLDSLLDGKMATEFLKKSYACMDITFTTTYGKLLLEKRWFA